MHQPLVTLKQIPAYLLKAFVLLTLTVVLIGFLSSRNVKADVPPECAEVYRENGAVPMTPNCEILAATASIGLSNFWCRNIAISEEFCDTPVVSDQWVGLDGLRANYQQEKQSDSPDTAFAHQFLCIAEKSCENFEALGKAGWAADFVKFLFEHMSRDAPFPESVSYNCPEFMSNNACFEYKGYSRHSIELVQGFYGYCREKGTRIDYDQWDSDHSIFLDKGVTQCLLEVKAAGDFNGVWAPRITMSAFEAREIIQLDCRVWNFIRTGYSFIADDPRDTLPAYNRNGSINFLAHLNNGNVTSADDDNEVIVPDNLRKDAPKREDFYHASWDTAGDLSVSVTDDTFFVRPGDQLVLSTSRTAADGTDVLLDAAAGLEYQLLTNSEVADISADGVLTINRVVSPFSTATISNVILVGAFADGQWGVGQVMVTDDDTDGDILLDSYEDAVGLNKLVATDVFADSDSNGLADIDDAVAYLESASGVIDTPPVNMQPPAPQQPIDPVAPPQGEGRSSGGGSVSVFALAFILLWRLALIIRASRPTPY